MRESECVSMSVSTCVTVQPQCRLVGFLQCGSSRPNPDGHGQAPVPSACDLGGTWKRHIRGLRTRCSFEDGSALICSYPSLASRSRCPQGPAGLGGGLERGCGGWRDGLSLGPPAAPGLADWPEAGHHCAHVPGPIFSSQPRPLYRQDPERFVCVSGVTQPLGARS